jgi:predicted exporter
VGAAVLRVVEGALIHPRRSQVGKWALASASVLGSLLVSVILIGAVIDSVCRGSSFFSSLAAMLPSGQLTQRGTEALSELGQSLDRLIAVDEPYVPRRHSLAPRRHWSGCHFLLYQGP